MRAARSVLTTQQIGMGGVTVPDSQSREDNLLASALTRARWPRSENWLDLFELIVGLWVPLALPLTVQKKSRQKGRGLPLEEETVAYKDVFIYFPNS